MKQGADHTQAASSPNATAPRGVLRLGLSSSGRDGYLFVPPSYRTAAKNTLMVVLHGAGKGGLDGLGVVLDQANSSGARGRVLRCNRLVAAAWCRDGQMKQHGLGQWLVVWRAVNSTWPALFGGHGRQVALLCG